jgi:large-conductance mechanosensitive channel
MSSFRQFLSGFRRGFSDFGELVTDVVNFVLLSFVYFIGVGLTALFAKASGKHFLSLGKDRKKATYWHEERIGTRQQDSYFRQF